LAERLAERHTPKFVDIDRHLLTPVRAVHHARSTRLGV
jgi:hypothetical protein